MRHVYHKDNRGYTFTEVIIAVVISLILMAAASATYISQNRSYVAQESVSEVNTQSLIAHSIITDSVRGVGFGVPDDLDENPINGYTTLITPLDRNNGTDAVTILTGRMIGQLWPVGTGPGRHGLCSGSSVDKASSPKTGTVDIVYSGATTPNNTDRRNLSMDGIEFATVSAVNASTVNLSENLGIPVPFP